MLERIESIQGIGLLHDANGKPYGCKKATLVYADNGRGKSTLASVLRSVSTADASLLAGRGTLDGSLPPKAVLQFGNGLKVIYDKSAWSERRPEVVVFDAEFVERNVHSGGTVSTGHRKNLLEFALGEAAVAARTELDKRTISAKAAADALSSSNLELSGYHIGMQLTDFKKMPGVPDADQKIEALRKRMAAASDTNKILSRAIPAAIPLPTLNTKEIFAGLSTSLNDIHADAEGLVKAHIAKIGNKSSESWISQGQQFSATKECPFCGQETIDNDLIRAYQSHFNAAYRSLKDDISGIQRVIETSTSPSIIDSFAQKALAVTAQISAWSDYVPCQEVSFEAEISRSALAKLHALLLDLARQKQASPTESVGSDHHRAEAADLWAQVVDTMMSANLTIQQSIDSIEAYKSQLATESVPLMQQEVASINASKSRYQANVVALIEKQAAAKVDADAAEKAKKSARDNLDALMKKALDQYEAAINVLLDSFGASFRIKGMGSNFRGTAPRTEYGLLLRGKDVSLEGGPPSFATALSEGDKRTLAFAFFVASTLADKKVSSRIVVIDDPMCSLDLNRRHHTRAILRKLYSKAEQLIVLAHDPYFIRDLRDSLLKEDKTTPIAVFQLKLCAGDYSDFATLDIDRECESPYFQHHRLLNDFVTGKAVEARSVAKAIRPMLEGYLHRRFPGMVPSDLMFGHVVAFIRAAVAPSPLIHAQTMTDALGDINDYAGQFHHDTNPGNADSVAIVSGELHTYAKQALHLVHKGAVP